MKRGLIYKHTLVLDCPSKGKSYIGQTCAKNPSTRWAGGRGYSRRNPVFYNAIKKYGWDNFNHEIIEDNIKTLEEANEREKYWIAFYHTYINDPVCHGYNMTAGGDGTAGHICSEQTKLKISLANKGKACWCKGKHLSEETKAKIRDSRLGKYCGENSCRFGKHLTAETRQKISQKRLGKATHKPGTFHHSEETKRKISTKNKGRMLSKEEKLKREIASHKVKVYCSELNKTFNSVKEAAAFIHISTSSIIKCCRGNNHTAGGYHWRYEEK